MASYTYNKSTGSYDKTPSTTSYTPRPKTTSTSTSTSTSSSTNSSTSTSTSTTQPRDVTTLPTWKGDPNDQVAIDAWKASYEPGYVPRIISPRDSSGNYTSDPAKTVSYITMDKETHAKEIAIALQSEPKIPMSIVDYLTKTLSSARTGKSSFPAPTATTTTKARSEEMGPRNLTNMTKGKYAALVAGLAVLIYGLLWLGGTK